MRVAVASWTSRRAGGIEEYVCILIPALRRAGVEVAFWHETDTPADRERINTDPEVSDFSAAAMGADASLRALRDWKPDVIYCQGLQSVELEERLLDIAPAILFVHSYTGTCISGSKTFTRPVIVPCSRAFGPLCLVHYFPHGCGGNNPVTMLKLYAEQSRRLRLLHRYRSILTHTDHMRDELRKNGVEAVTVPYPVETQTLSDARVSDGSLRLLFVGRMEAVKGGQLLIDAIPEVWRQTRRRIRVALAGDGAERAAWEVRAAAISKAIPDVLFEFTGWLRQDEIGALMKNADLLVVPSIWPEPFGSVGPGAAQHGVPAAAFAVGGIPQWLVDGVTGHLAPADPPTVHGLADAIVRCVETPEHYVALREGARRKAEQFTMERHMPDLLRALAA